MDDHCLNRPVWNALVTEHAGFSIGSLRARCFESDISPFGAACDESAESLAELGSLTASAGRLILAQADAIICPPSASLTMMTPALQMVFDASKLAQRRGLTIRKLGPQDAPAMIALATLTKPGPFAERTYVLGEFWGIERDGRLVAMAGERLKQPGFTEISGVCTHPDYLGHGYAKELCLMMLTRITGRGEQPYLHVFTSNEAAIALYRKLGFRERRKMHIGVLEPA